MSSVHQVATGFKGELRKIEVAGKAMDRGYKYGALCKDDIGHFVEYLKNEVEKSKICADGQIWAYVRRCMPYIEEYSPEIAEEMKGIAKGAGRSYEEIMMLSLLEEIESSSCTTFAATGRATANGETYLGQTWDNTKDPNYATPLLVNVKPDSEPTYLTYTYPGLLAGAGMNSMGIGISWNTVPFLDREAGVPTYLIVAEILRQKTIGNAIDAVLRADRAGCFNFVIGDKAEIYDIEATPHDADISYCERYMGHANHFVSEKFRKRQDMRKTRASTFIRHNRINKILGEHYGSIDLNVCINVLRDHENYPDSICRHEDRESKQLAETEAAWVMVPAKREMWISYGLPCQHEFEKYVV